MPAVKQSSLIAVATNCRKRWRCMSRVFNHLRKVSERLFGQGFWLFSKLLSSLHHHPCCCWILPLTGLPCLSVPVVNNCTRIICIPLYLCYSFSHKWFNQTCKYNLICLTVQRTNTIIDNNNIKKYFIFPIFLKFQAMVKKYIIFLNQ